MESLHWGKGGKLPQRQEAAQERATGWGALVLCPCSRKGKGHPLATIWRIFRGIPGARRLPGRANAEGVPDCDCTLSCYAILVLYLQTRERGASLP